MDLVEQMLVSYLKNTLKLAAIILLLCVSYTTYEYRISTNIKDEIIVYIPHHTSSREIAKILQESGAINSLEYLYLCRDLILILEII